MDNYIGKKIDGRYEVTELIGVGGMANVYKAVDAVDGKTVAVKILREEFYSNDEFLRRFKNESKAIAVLSHPNIIKVYDVSFSNRMQSIVMEYIDGITLKEYIEQQGKLTWKEAVHFTDQILAALQHAHDKGIVHRDIKPQNVMLLTDGSIRITDFGIARFARSETRTITDRAIGSVHYISPEQARGEHTDQRTDLYSVGVMLYEMLTGQLPFEADSPVSVALKQIQTQAPPPSSVNPGIPEALEEITLRAMEKDPERRYQSAAEMLRDLEAFKNNPSAKFEYKYLTSEPAQEERYQKAFRSVRKREDQMKSQKKTPQKKPVRTPSRRPEPDEEEERSRSASVIPILAGITAAFVVISGVFIATMLYLNNPFEKVPDVTVPDLVGLRYDSIKDAPQYEEFVIEVEGTESNDLYDKGIVFDQSPKAGKTVKANSKIKVMISEGAAMITMPNLIGMEENAAVAKLTELDLPYTRSEVFSTQAPGTVVSTEPGRDSQITAGTNVKLQISMGPENKVVEVPDVVGRSLADAKLLIEARGLQLGGVSYVVSNEPYDTVTFQDPAFGSQISTGGFVNLNVSGGSNQKTVVQLAVKLPADVEGLVKMQAVANGNVIKEEMVEPKEALYWRPAFEGTGTVTIHVLYNDFLYQTFELNFDTGSSKMTEDNSANHP
ncbi:MAG TPA: Stk1 family PASTA domain-containing Ser/Thr kinase [Candidatus Fimivivens faecavium]|nr:Stk1 family PASTA domain-containing Ser/Thr kinase [Candidatus Fimivivens faecavium]